MTRPTAADRIADLTAEVDQQRTRAEAAEAELQELRNQCEELSARNDNLREANEDLRKRIEKAIELMTWGAK